MSIDTKAIRERAREFWEASPTETIRLCDALDAARAELAQARQEKEMLRALVASVVRCLDNGAPAFDIRAMESSLRAALAGIKETT